MNYALDLLTVGRYVATQVADGGDAPPSVAELAASYRPPNPPDLTRVIGFEDGVDNDQQAKEWMVRRALERLERYFVLDGDVPRFRDGYTLADVKWERKKLHPLRYEEGPAWAGAFDKHRTSGVFAKNVRLHTARDDGAIGQELEASLREFGWVEEFPAIRDEYGVVLVGHRRLAIAERLGIEPRIKTIRLGSGSEGDAYRFKLAVASNLGGKPFTTEERKRIAVHLYQDAEWSVDRVAQALGASHGTITNDLKDIPKRHGRARKAEWTEVHDPIIRRYIAGEISEDEAVALGKATGVRPVSKGTYGRRRELLEVLPKPSTADGLGAPSPTPDPATNGAPETPTETEPELVERLCRCWFNTAGEIVRWELV